MKFTGEEQCWERMRCGRERDGTCPSDPDTGCLCRSVAGTKCPEGVKGTHVRTVKACESGEFFQAVVFS